MSEEVWLAISTFPDEETARLIARQVLTENLVACANLLPAVESIYRWEGKLEETRETMVFFKTTPTRFPALRARLQALHPYNVPELLALPVAAGSPDYLRWVAEACARPIAPNEC